MTRVLWSSAGVIKFDFMKLDLSFIGEVYLIELNEMMKKYKKRKA